MNDEEQKKNVITTIGDLKEAMADIQDEKLYEQLQSILDAKATQVNIIYEDIDVTVSFIVKPLTVAIQMELEMFPTSLQKYRHLISRLVTTVDKKPLSYKEIDIMPYGMQKALSDIVEEIAFSHQTERKKLEDS
jgi:hypothetical protein